MDEAEAARTRLGRAGLLALATAIWAAVLALASFGPGRLWNDQMASWIAVGATVVAGVAWIIVHARFLAGGDELERKIMLEAIAVAVGAGLVGGFSLGAAQNARLVEIEADLGVMSILIAVVYMIGIVVGRVRYR